MNKKNPRDYGSGSVFQRSDGLWIGRIEAGWTAKGERRRIQVSAKTEAECKRRLVKKKRELAEHGVPTEGLASTTSVKVWSEQWLLEQQRRLASHTWGSYAGTVRKWIVPTIGHKRLANLTPGDLRAVTRAEEQAGKKPASTLATRRILVKMLRDARIEGHPIPARIFDVKAHTPPPSDRDAIPLADAIAIMNASLTLPHTSRWIVAFFEGMRQGEVLGLTWDHVDLDRGIIDIEYQLDSLAYLDREAGTFRHPDRITPKQLWRSYHLVPPKSKSGRRIIPIVGPALAALQQWRELAPPSPHGLVWPRPDGRPINPQHDTAEWIDLQDRAQVASVDGNQGRRYAGHEIRHTTATILLEIGADPRTVEAILGHSSIVTSRGYQHVRDELSREAMQKVSDRFAFTFPESPRPIES
ncbi:tyrosine-type recombinase/integrase [Aeromicrobium marinum]|uniref:tyrosine-type recombinase/integrase n=1 Tax=Aeromicrobium marinum TaxID=219314 RepID=UPI0001BCD69E|nr:site-specific integrase [Aeromicrobium marinum]